MSGKITQETMDQVIVFHGHWCPGLAIGIRAAQWAVQELGRASDEDIVALVETDMCGVDAIQFLTGCTFGKGNLVYRDYGKNAFTFYRRRDGKAMRLVMKPELLARTRNELAELHKKMVSRGLTPEETALMQEARARYASQVMELDMADLFDFKEPNEPMPRTARILSSLVCSHCKEAAMETRTRQVDGKTLCLPCFVATEDSGKEQQGKNM